MTSPRNAAVVAVPETDVLAAFERSLSTRRPFAVAIPQGVALPANCTLLGVHHDYLTRVFYFAVAHPAFAPVAEGERLPVLSPGYVYETDEADPPVVMATNSDVGGG